MEHASRSPITEPKASPCGRILVAEDDDAMRELVVQALIGEGHEVYEAADGEELLRIVQSVKVNSWPVPIFDVLVLDVTMPAVSGLEALRRLRTVRCDTPTILMTAFPDATLRARAGRLGASVIAKPFERRVLTTAVREILSCDARAVELGAAS